MTTSSLYPAPFIPYGAPGYDAARPIASDGFPQSIGEWVNGFPEFDKSVEIKPPMSVVQAFGGGGSTPNHCRMAATMNDGNYSRLWLTVWVEAMDTAGIPGHRESRPLSAFPARVIDGLGLAALVERFPQGYVAQPSAPMSVTSGGVVQPTPVFSTPPTGYVRTDSIRAALDLPKGSRRTYWKLRAAILTALGT